MGNEAIAVYQRLARDFPTFVADSLEFRSFSGFLRVRGRDYRVQVCPSSPVCSVRGDEALRKVIAGVSHGARLRVATAPDAHAMLIELRDIIERACSQILGDETSFDPTKLPPASFYDGLLQELEQIGWNFVDSMDETMRRIRINVADKAERIHAVSIAFPSEYPKQPPQVSAALPEQFNVVWSRNATLGTVVDQFRDELDKYQELFDVFDDIDAHCWVLEPEKPLRSDLYRRIAIAKHSSLRIELDPRAPTRAVPDCRFLGSEAAVRPLRERLNENMGSWDTSGGTNPRVNLEQVLGLGLPKPANRQDPASQEMGLECGICYSYRLEDRVPEVACDRSTCARPFHRECLIEWLKALPDTRQSFETYFGACPYCEHPISVSSCD